MGRCGTRGLASAKLLPPRASCAPHVGPMQPATLSAAGLPVLSADEVELVLIPRATFENAGSHRFHLTNTRLIGVSEVPRGARCVKHESGSMSTTTATHSAQSNRGASPTRACLSWT